MNTVYGVDLGTTFTKCALCEGNDVRVFDLDVELGDVDKPNPARLRGLRSTVTVGSISRDRVAYVGSRAIRARERWKREQKPHYAFEEAKLWIGTDLRLADERDPPPWQFDDHNWVYRPEDVGALVLRAVKKEVERVGGPPMNQIVVTHPAQFDSTQQQATRHAAALANITVLDLLTEPEAAAIAYSRVIKEDGQYLIFDLGGGTLDLVLLEIKDRQFRTVTKSGARIGGRDFDRAVMDAMIMTFMQKTDDVFQSTMLGPLGEQLWMAHAERIKRRLNDPSLPATQNVKFDIPVDSQYALDSDMIREPFQPKFVFDVCRQELDEKMEEKLNDSRDLIASTLAHARTDWSGLKGIISVGGSTHLLAIRQLLDELSGGKVLRSLDPDTVVAQGAAVYAASLASRAAQVSVPDDLIKRTPYRGTLFRSVGVRVDNPDGSGRVVTLVKKGTPTPLEKPLEKVFKTSKPNQDHILVQLYEGEATDADDPDNNRIGECRIDGFTPSEKPQQVTVGIQIEGNDTKRIIVKIDGRAFEQQIHFDPSKVLEHHEVEKRREFLSTLVVLGD